MNTILVFLLFYFLISLYGNGFVKLFKISSKELFKLPTILFYPIIGLFFIGNISVLLNFFIKLTDPIARVVLLSMFFLNLLKFKTPKFITNKFIHFIVIPAILAISSFGVGLAGDAGLYHLNHQEWLRSNKIVFGLVNAHFRFGFSSISEWIGANFWIQENLLLLHFTNLIFIVFFFQVIFHYIFNEKNKIYQHSFIGVLIVGFLDNFGFNGGKNGFIEIEAVTKSDTVFAILFFITSIFIFQIYNRDFQTRDELFILSLLSLFTFQYRIFGVLIILFHFYVILKKNELLSSIRTSKLSLAFLTLWIVKNFVNTACLFYPITLSCFETSFAATEYASTDFALKDLNYVHTPLRSLNLSEWFLTWVQRDINQIVLYNFIVTLLVLIIYTLFLFKNTEKETVHTKSLLTFSIISFTIWILSSPGIRLGIGVLLLLYIVLPNLLNLKKPRFEIVNNKIILLTLFFSTLLLVPQTNNYRILIESINSLEIKQMQSQKINYVKNPNGFGVIPESNSDKCWININCIRNQDEIIKVLNNGYVFLQAKN